MERLLLQADRTWNNPQAKTTDTRFSNPASTPLTIKTIDPSADDASAAQFYRRVRAEMIAERIKNCLDTVSWENLQLKRQYFTWTDANGDVSLDGPTMLAIIVQT